jgi:hypothetical protein
LIGTRAVGAVDAHYLPANVESFLIKLSSAHAAAPGENVKRHNTSSAAVINGANTSS